MCLWSVNTSVAPVGLQLCYHNMQVQGKGLLFVHMRLKAQCCHSIQLSMGVDDV
jgi:hypothetical protein